MRTSELRQLNDAELAAELVTAREELFNLRFQLSTRQLKDHRAIERARKRIARALTLQHERALAAVPSA